MNNPIRRFFTKSTPAPKMVDEPTSDQSGVRVRPTEEVFPIAQQIHISDNDYRFISCVHESDMMVKLSIICPFLAQRDYQQEVSDYLFSHFDRVFTFHPDSGRMTAHSR